MNWSQWIRRAHRWLSIAFTLGFVVNLVVAVRGVEPAPWVYLLAVAPLFLLLPTGLYMFASPYAARLRGGKG